MEKAEPQCRKEKEKGKYLIGLWLTKGCNLECAYCFQDTPRPNDVMSKKTLKQTIKFINGFDVQGVAFFGGEPLLQKKSFKRVLEQTNVPRYYLTTNGTLLDDDIFDLLELHKVHLNLSLDGAKDTHDKWRDNSYDRIIENLPRILGHIDSVSGQPLMTCVTESQIYRNVKHIKDLGFPSVYINQLDPYGTRIRNDIEKIDIFKEQYRKVLRLHGKEFEVSDYARWKQVLNTKQSGQCGFNKFGLGISPTGKFSPCHRGPELPEEFTFGDVFNGIDYDKMREIRARGVQPEFCALCDVAFNQCPVSCYQEHGEFGKAPHGIRCAYERAKVEVINDFALKDLKAGDASTYKGV